MGEIWAFILSITPEQWITYIGPMGIVVFVFVIVFKRIKAVRGGVQAILRDRLYQLYGYCEQKGYAKVYERENFDNMYKHYHNLGQNGVMDSYKKKFEALPTHD